MVSVVSHRLLHLHAESPLKSLMLCNSSRQRGSCRAKTDTMMMTLANSGDQLKWRSGEKLYVAHCMHLARFFPTHCICSFACKSGAHVSPHSQLASSAYSPCMPILRCTSC